MQQPTSLRRHPHTGEILRPVYFTKDGTPRYPILGAAEGDEPSDETPRTFTQEEVNALATREKQQGKKAGARELLESLGFEKPEDAQAFIKAQRDAEESAKTEAQKLADQAARDKAEAEKSRAETAAEKRATQIERALLRAKVKDDDLEDAAYLLAKDLDADADADAITAAATTLKERRKELFEDGAAGSSHERRRSGLPKGRPGAPKKPEGAQRGAGGLAAAKARGFLKDED